MATSQRRDTSLTTSVRPGVDGPGRQLQTRPRLAEDLRALGVEAGDVLLVHASMRQLGWVVGGAPAVVHALRDAVGPEGTIVVPTITADNSDPSNWERTRREPVPEEWWAQIREHLPAFDPAVTPSWRMGAIAEAVRTWPGSVRSTHPQTSFAAVGALAATLMAEHDLTCHYGERSPLARLHDRSANVLLLGVSYDVCTAFHLAEYRVPGPAHRSYECVVADGDGRRWVCYQDVVLDASDFALLGRAFEESDGTGPLVRSGWVGQAPCRLFPLRDAVEFATGWMRTHRLVVR